MTLSAVALNCTLKSSPAPSSCQKMLDLVAEELGHHGVDVEHVRIADHDVRPGVSADEGDGDEWPSIRAKLLDAEILLLGTPIWLGSPSSLCKLVCERLDAMLGEIDDQGRTPLFGKVAAIAVVGNEDGAHHVSAECYQWLSDVGYTIPPSATAYWVGEAMGRTDFQDLPEVPERVRSTIAVLASSVAHVAALLGDDPYPGSA